MICKRWNVPLLCSGTNIESSEESMPTMPVEQLEGEGMNQVEEELLPMTTGGGEMMQGGDIPMSTAAMAVRLGGMGI